MTQPIIIIGTGGSAFDVLDTITAINAINLTWSVAGFLDDARKPGSCYLGFPILGSLSEAGNVKDHFFINSIGSDKSYVRRPDFVAGINIPHDQFATLIHPGASVSSYARVGRGTLINYGVSVGGEAMIGDHVFLGPGCIIGHNSTVDDYSIVAPGSVISGFVHVGRNSYVGAAACIRQGLRIEEQALVGMGAVVIASVPARQIVVGNPARALVRKHLLDVFSNEHP